MSRPSILVVDDEEVIRSSCAEVFSLEGYDVTTAEDGEGALEAVGSRGYDLVLLDLRLPQIDGMALLDLMLAADPTLVVVVVTGVGTVESAVEAIKRGAHDFLCKPLTPGELRLIGARGLEARRLRLESQVQDRELSRLREKVQDENFLIGRSAAIGEVRLLVRKVAPTDSTVLLLGESGTGKEVVARLIHQESLRRRGPMLTVDCGALVETLFESELFGHSRGSFTGAVSTRYGRFELANGGTLFLDEIGNLTPSVQSKMLRAIQEREITRVGSSQPIRVDLRVIAATNEDIIGAVACGRFREDLFYRLSVVPIELPPLRTRLEDVPPLVEYFLTKHGRRLGRVVEGASTEALAVLGSYDWPGNVRELESVIERAIVMSEGPLLRREDLTFFGRRSPPLSAPPLRSLDDVEARHIRHVLEAMKGQLGRSADVLGINRKTLRLKLRRHNIELDGDGAES